MYKDNSINKITKHTVQSYIIRKQIRFYFEIL